MRIYSENDRASIELTLHDVAPEQYASGDRGLSMLVNAYGYTGAEPQVWFRAEAISRFLGELDALEAGNANRATLLSIDAEAAAAGSRSVVGNQLALHRLDDLRHVGVQVILGRGAVVRGLSARLALEATFEIDPTRTLAIFRELRRLLA